MPVRKTFAAVHITAGTKTASRTIEARTSRNGSSELEASRGVITIGVNGGRNDKTLANGPSGCCARLNQANIGKMNMRLIGIIRL